MFRLLKQNSGQGLRVPVPAPANASQNNTSQASPQLPTTQTALKPYKNDDRNNYEYTSVEVPHHVGLNVTETFFDVIIGTLVENIAQLYGQIYNRNQGGNGGSFEQNVVHFFENYNYNKYVLSAAKELEESTAQNKGDAVEAALGGVEKLMLDSVGTNGLEKAPPMVSAVVN